MYKKYALAELEPSLVALNTYLHSRKFSESKSVPSSDKCAGRESDSGHLVGNEIFYRLTTSAYIIYKIII